MLLWQLDLSKSRNSTSKSWILTPQLSLVIFMAALETNNCSSKGPILNSLVFCGRVVGSPQLVEAMMLLPPKERSSQTQDSSIDFLTTGIGARIAKLLALPLSSDGILPKRFTLYSFHLWGPRELIYCHCLQDWVSCPSALVAIPQAARLPPWNRTLILMFKTSLSICSRPL